MHDKQKVAALHEKFMACCNKLGSQSVEVAESDLIHLKRSAATQGFTFERLHRLHVRLQSEAAVLDLKLNYHDFEYYVFVSDKPEKVFSNISEIKPWLEKRFNRLNE